MLGNKVELWVRSFFPTLHKLSIHVLKIIWGASVLFFFSQFVKINSSQT